MGKSSKEEKQQKGRLVEDTAAALRELILDAEPGHYLGSLTDIAEQLNVGIVTIQQSARVLEYEGLLQVKRGPGGGYYGTRPDDAALERTFATYMRIHNISYREAFELSVLLDCEIIKSAAQSDESTHIAHLEDLQQQLERCETAENVIEFEYRFRETLLNIFNRPLLELLSKVAMQLYVAKGDPAVFTQSFGIDGWKQGRQKILQAILKQDDELAYFEAQRFRTMTMKWMARDF